MASQEASPEHGASFKYWAFVSYSHRDRGWGDWLHKALETYRVPRRLRGTRGRDGPLPRRILPVFRDREELPTSADLGGAIGAALHGSRYLVVICSPASARSIWVNEEVRNFKRIGRANRIMCLVVDGEPNATDHGRPERESFCPALRYDVDRDGAITDTRVEPLAADVRAFAAWRALASMLAWLRIDLRRWQREALIKLVAGILGVDFDRLWQRERRRRTWRRAHAALVTAALAAGSYAIWHERSKSESRELASRALKLVKDERHDEALRVLLNAVPETPGLLARPLVAEPEAALELVLARNRLHTLLGGIKYETESIEMSRDGRLMATSSRDGTVRLWDTASWTQTGVRYAFDRVAAAHPARGPKAEPELARRPLALHPTEPLLAVGTVDGPVLLFDTGTRTGPVATLRHAAGADFASSDAESRRYLVRAVAFDAGGERLLSASEDHSVRVWDWRRGEVLLHLIHPAPVLDAQFHPGGHIVATICVDGMTRLWDAASGTPLAALATGAGAFSMLRFSPDGMLLGVAADWRAALWRIENPRTPTLIAELSHDDAVRWIEFNRDAGNPLVATAADDGTARLWSTTTGAELLKVRHRRSVRRALFDPNGTRFATVSEDRLVQLWDIVTGRPVPGYALHGHTHFVFAGAFVPGGTHLVTASSDMTLRVWSLAEHTRGLRLAGHRAAARQAVFTPDGSRVLTAGLDRRALLFDATTGVRLAEYPDLHPDRVLGLALSPDGERFVTVSRDRTARLWSLAQPGQFRVLARDPVAAVAQSHEGDVLSASFSPDGRFILTTSRDSTARLWDAGTGLPLDRVPPLRHTAGKPVWHGAFSGDGRLIVTAGHDEQAGLWDAATGRHLRWLRPEGSRKAGMVWATFSPDDKLIATASDDRMARLWDVASGRQIGAPLLHEDAVLSVVFHPSGKYMVSGSSSGTLRHWSVPDGALLGVWYAHEDQAVRSIAFDRTGRRLVTAAEDGTAQIWPTDVARGQLLTQAFAVGRRICRRTPGTPEWSDVWRWCPVELAR